MNVEIRRGSSRFAERVPGRLTQHAFSFGPDLDPERLAFGPMVCHDDHLLGRGQGFEDHPHAGLEIVSWVLAGSLVHTDGTGAAVTLGAGECGVLTAGAGVRHSELAGDAATRFVQVWLTPDDPDVTPSYRTASVEPGPGLVRVVGEGAALTVGVAGAALDVARLEAGESVTLPDAAKVHAFVATGALLRSSLAEPLSAGDAFLLTGPASYDVTAAVPTELLVWSFA